MGAKSKILTHAGLLDKSGNLTKTAKDTFIKDVSMLLINGNLDGKGMKNAITMLLPIPPSDPTPKIIDPLTLQEQQLLRFGPDPFAFIQVPILENPKLSPMFHKFFLDGLYEKTAQALDLQGNIIAPAIFDPTIPFPDVNIKKYLPKLKFPITPDILIDIGIELDVPPKLPTIEVGLPIPSFPSLPPKLPFPDLPNIPVYDLILYKLIIGIFARIPPLMFNIDFFKKIAFQVPQLPIGPFKLILNLLLQILLEVYGLLGFPILPRTLIAVLLVYLKNLAAMLLCLIVGSILGTGQLVKVTAALTGLVI